MRKWEVCGVRWSVLGLGLVLGGLTQVAAATPTAKEAHAITLEAYIFGYPLVTMEYTRRVG